MSLQKQERLNSFTLAHIPVVHTAHPEIVPYAGGKGLGGPRCSDHTVSQFPLWCSTNRSQTQLRNQHSTPTDPQILPHYHELHTYKLKGQNHRFHLLQWLKKKTTLEFSTTGGTNILGEMVSKRPSRFYHVKPLPEKKKVEYEQ